MTRMRMAIAAAAMAGSMLTGGVIGATVFSVTSAAAASPTPAATAPAQPGSSGSSGSSGSAASPGAFKSNEDPTHEAGESAAREAAEDAGQAPAPGSN